MAHEFYSETLNFHRYYIRQFCPLFWDTVVVLLILHLFWAVISFYCSAAVHYISKIKSKRNEPQRSVSPITY